MIIVTERGRDNLGLLIIENIDKTAIAKVAKVLSAIDLDSKYSSVISNSNIDVVEDLKLINIEKY